MMAWLKPEKRRWIILALIFGAMVLNYIDRQIVSVLKPTLKTEFGIDDRGYATLINAFVFCYAASYMGAGWLVDRLNAKRFWGATTFRRSPRPTLGVEGVATDSGNRNRHRTKVGWRIKPQFPSYQRPFLVPM